MKQNQVSEKRDVVPQGKKCQISDCSNKATVPLRIHIYDWMPVDFCKPHADKWMKEAKPGAIEYRMADGQ